MLKKAYFWKKNYKKSLQLVPELPAAGGSAPRSPRCYSRLLLQLC